MRPMLANSIPQAASAELAAYGLTDATAQSAVDTLDLQSTTCVTLAAFATVPLTYGTTAVIGIETTERGIMFHNARIVLYGLTATVSLAGCADNTWCADHSQACVTLEIVGGIVAAGVLASCLSHSGPRTRINPVPADPPIPPITCTTPDCK